MIYFPCGTNGKLIILGVPILKHITVYQSQQTTSVLLRQDHYKVSLSEVSAPKVF